MVLFQRCSNCWGVPAAIQKIPVLGGRGVIIEYANRPGKFFYRELVEGCRRYRSILIKNARTVKEAEDLAIDAYGLLRQTEEKAKVGLQPDSYSTHSPEPSRAETPRARKKAETGLAVATAIEHFLQAQQEKVDAGLLKEITLKEKKQVLRKHLLTYLASERINTVGQITQTTFQKYPLYRKEASKLTRQKELVIIKHFIDSHLARNNLISPEIGLCKELIPKISIKKQDLDANPAINPSDWRIINNYIRLAYVKKAESHPRRGVHYWRMLFWTFTIVAKNTGCRPVELLALRWADAEIEDIGYHSKATNQHKERLIAHIVVRASKTGEQREIPANVGDALRRWAEYQHEYLQEHKPNIKVNGSTLVFGNPARDMRAYTYPTYTAAWKQIMEGVSKKMKGHKFSTRNYTIYSMRSTFIENNLIKGMDIFLLARLCGHSVPMLMKHYERIDVRKRAREITHFEYGKKAYKAKTVSVIQK